uniref:uncharacterized protein LOC109957940 n=1 Tax=Monopterus albus TaxID=43700 RepID=UPI0009B3BB66|nr:uncharacterized protein LOC109957940 [Monopterus albus]
MESSLEFSNSLGSVSSLLTRYRTFKVLMIGDSGVGKTCLTHRICGGQFPSRVEATIGVDFRERLLDIDGEKIKLQLWDTAGQERFRKSMVQHYYRNVHAVLFIYDVICPGSFNGLIAWIEECRQNSLGQDIPRHTGNIRTHTSSPAADNTVNMFSRRAWQRVGPLARRAFRFVSGNAPVRQMAFRLPGHTTNKTYILLCGGGLTAAVVYAYKTVRGDSECYKGKSANMGSAAKAPAAETTPIKEAAEVISKSSPTPAEPVAEAATEPVIEVASEEAATKASGGGVTEEAETTPTAPEAASEVVVTEEAVPLVVGEAAPEAAPVATVPSEALAAESGGTAAVDEAPPTPPTEAETAPTAPEAADVSAAEVAA